MKNAKLIFFTLISLIAISPVMVFASSIKNIYGIEITDEEYNNFSKMYSDEYLITMDEAKYERLKSYNYDNIESKTIYVETKYNPHLNLTTNKIITEEEYEALEPNIMPILDDKGTMLETSAKKFTLTLGGGSTWNHVMATATWKTLPTNRSFDVIGFRGFNFSVRNGSQTGDQIYIESGSYKDISYDSDSKNMKQFSTTGFGFSMNIVNNTISFLQTIAECDIKVDGVNPAIHAAYEHAIKDITLETSQSYTLGAAGMGGVFVFPSNIVPYYDAMDGLYLQY